MKRMFFFIIFALVIVGLYSCKEIGGYLEDGNVGKSCEDKSDCAYGEECVSNVCAPTFCSTNDDCGSNSLQCCSGECIAASEVCQAVCLTDRDCDGGLCLAGRCVFACGDGGLCPEEQWCVPYLNVCLPKLNQPNGDGDIDSIDGLDIPDIDIDLPEGMELPELDLEQCNTSEDCDNAKCIAGVCVNAGGADGQGCQSNADCAAGQSCILNICMGQPADGPCQSNEDCDGGICISAIGVCIGGNPGNDRCMSDADCNEYERCVFGVCVGGSSNTDGDYDIDKNDRDRRDRDFDFNQDNPEVVDTIQCTSDTDCPTNTRCVFGYCI